MDAYVASTADQKAVSYMPFIPFLVSGPSVPSVTLSARPSFTLRHVTQRGWAVPPSQSWPPAPPRSRWGVLVTPAAGSVSPTITPTEAQFVRLINADRAARGLSSLQVDARLVLAARSHCRDMGARGCLSHDSSLPGQDTPLDRYRLTLARTGAPSPRSLLVGENVLYRSQDAPDEAAVDHRALMGSPGHRANILNDRFTKVGVGFYQDDQGAVWITEMFLRDRP